MSTNETNNVNQPANIIRRLGLIESLYDDDVLNGSLILSRAFHTQVPRSYALNATVLVDALHVWAKKYPLAKVKAPGSHSPARSWRRWREERAADQPSSTFVHHTRHQVLRLHATAFTIPVRQRRLCRDERRRARVAAGARELIKPFDTDNGPLWHLKLLKIIDMSKEYAQANTDKFVFIFSTHHSIGDGKQLHIFHLIQFDAVKYASFE